MRMWDVRLRLSPVSTAVCGLCPPMPAGGRRAQQRTRTPGALMGPGVLGPTGTGCPGTQEGRVSPPRLPARSAAGPSRHLLTCELGHSLGSFLPARTRRPGAGGCWPGGAGRSCGPAAAARACAAQQGPAPPGAR